MLTYGDCSSQRYRWPSRFLLYIVLAVACGSAAPMSLKWVAVEVIEVFQDRGTISSESRSRLLSHITSATENCVGMYPEVVAIEQLLGYSPSTSPRDGTQATAVVARELIAMGVLSHVLFQGSLSSEEMKHRNIEAPLNLHNAAHVRIEFVCTPQSRK